jgi:hypothetical protein
MKSQNVHLQIFNILIYHIQILVIKKYIFFSENIYFLFFISTNTKFGSMCKFKNTDFKR